MHGTVGFEESNLPFSISDIYDHLEQEMPHSVNVTQEDQHAIARVCRPFTCLIRVLFISPRTLPSQFPIFVDWFLLTFLA